MSTRILSSRHREALEHMERFLASTGQGSVAGGTRYLWTDAFAVCNYLGLHLVGGQSRYLRLALALVERVHEVLGRHRADDPRSGWISGLTEEKGLRHPTIGGLRIGKPIAERRPDEVFDSRTEWERDGQYFHYLTKWMHALQRVWEVTGEERYHTWATELAHTICEQFTAGVSGSARLYWKMSVDLSRAQVPSSGLHDPIDGLITLSALVASAPVPGEALTRLAPALESLEGMCRSRTWATDDPLGAGGLLIDVYRCVLWQRHRPELSQILPGLVRDAIGSTEAVAASDVWQQPAARRLAFRELGFSIGIRAAQSLAGKASRPARSGKRSPPPSQEQIAALAQHEALADRIERFWMNPRHQRARGWREHREISRVMLATSLLPVGFLGSAEDAD